MFVIQSPFLSVYWKSNRVGGADGHLKNREIVLVANDSWGMNKVPVREL